MANQRSLYATPALRSQPDKARRLARGVTLATACALAAGLPGPTQAANTRYADTTIFVRLKFDGDPGFPNLTSYRNTAGLAPFTGSAFGLTSAQRNEVVNTIISRLRERFAAFDIEFVTTNTGPASHYTWGIDDSGYSAPTDNPCEDLGTNARIFGKAIGGRDTDRACPGAGGGSLFQPRHARTWAGSFAMAGAGEEQSQPSLRLGNTLPGVGPVTVAHIARALGNSATHEIAHLFGLQHASCGDMDIDCKKKEVMLAADEEIEATNDKKFNDSNISDLRVALGGRKRLVQPSRGLLHDPGSGVMLTQDVDLPATVVVAMPRGHNPLVDLRNSYGWAKDYAAGLDYLGYDDWRLPNAANADGSGPCVWKLAVGASILKDCDKSDLGRLYHRLLPWEATDLVGASHFTQRYWSSDLAGKPWVAQRNTSEQYAAGTVANARVWPMRDGARLVDNGDGTITDTRRGLMWIKDARRSMTYSWSQAGASTVYAGYSDWRAPRIDDLPNDYTCEVPRSEGYGCTRNEMAHLFHGWGIKTASPSPFVDMSSPDVDFWFSTAVPGDLNNGYAFSFHTGLIRKLPRTTRLPVLWVRDFKNGVPAGNAVTADPHPLVTLRFKQVTRAGTLTASFVPGTPDRLGYNAARTWSFQSGLAYTPGDNAAKICLRYEHWELPNPVYSIGLSGPAFSIGMWGPTSNGPGRMPLANGYPDTKNKVVCAWAPYLDKVKVASFTN